MEEKQQHGRWKYLMCIWFGIFCFPLIAIAAQGVIKVKGYFSEVQAIYNPQNHLAADNKTTCFIFPLKQKTKRLKKRSKQHTKSVIQMLFKSH